MGKQGEDDKQDRRRRAKNRYGGFVYTVLKKKSIGITSKSLLLRKSFRMTVFVKLNILCACKIK